MVGRKAAGTGLIVAKELFIEYERKKTEVLSTQLYRRTFVVFRIVFFCISLRYDMFRIDIAMETLFRMIYIFSLSDCAKKFASIIPSVIMRLMEEEENCSFRSSGAPLVMLRKFVRARASCRWLCNDASCYSEN